MFDFYKKCEVDMIPDISDELIEKMAVQIKPVKLVNEYRYRLIDIDGVDRRNTAFTWEPKLGRLVRIYGGLETKEIMTFHTWAYYGFFKPTLAEVYACINQFVPDWSMVKFFRLKSENMGMEAVMGDYHFCRCDLWGEEQTTVQDAEWERDSRELVKEKSAAR